MSDMELWVGRDSAYFTARAGAFVAGAVERNVLATVLAGVTDGRYDDAIFALAGVGDEVAGVALRTPPHHMLAAGQIEDVDGFVGRWAEVDPGCSGVSAEPGLADALAGAWTRLTGTDVEVHLQEALHVLTHVVAPVRKVPGALELADWRRSAQLGEWGVAFAAEAGVRNPQQASIGIDHAIHHRRLWVWAVDGQPVTLIGHTTRVAGTVRLGPVYTPQSLRGRGYATAATAALSQRLLDGGAERCALYTDLANPISNHIYAKIGYVRVADWKEIAYGANGDPAAA